MPNYSGIWTEQAVMQAVGADNWPGNPGAPTIGTATAGDASASVTFTAPTNTGQSAITSYTVTSSPGGVTGTGASSPVTVSGLTNGTAYTFTVTATNATGTGPASAASNSVTPAVPSYIEDVFSTYLWTGNGSTQTITNNIDLSTKGGMVWIKSRSNTFAHRVFDTTRGATKFLATDAVGAEDTNASSLTAFTSSGFSVGASTAVNDNAATYCAWTFREQPKFFDVVTYTGNGAADRNITHNLGSVPGMIVIKKTSGTGNWATAASLSSTVYAIGGGGSGSGYEFALNTTDTYYDNPLKSTIATDTTVNVPRVYYNDATVCNASGATYVMYLFASNAGGFGASGTDNVISCGSFSTDGSGGYSVNLGYEAQYVLLKRTNGTGGWFIVDIMRGAAVTASTTRLLSAQVVAAESTDGVLMSPSATGFFASSTLSNLSSGSYIYIAIRRGPMKVPTSGTSVFSPITNSATTGTVNTTGFPVDMGIVRWRDGTDSNFVRSRLQGVSSTTTESGAFLKTNATDAESTSGGLTRLWDNTGFQTTSGFSGYSTVYWNFGRAPSFFDEVCYTGGTGTPRVLNHNLTTPPELVITKIRNFAGEDWVVHYNNGSSIIGGYLNNTTAFANSSTAPSTDITSLTSTTYTLNTSNRRVNGAYNYVAYLFATCAGVSKVGSYTGNGSTQTINCGFTGGARFVLIKRTDSTGDWYVYDTARGMTVLTDPYLFLNSTAAETATLGSVTTVSTGFAVNASILAAINTNAASYIFLAIA